MLRSKHSWAALAFALSLACTKPPPAPPPRAPAAPPAAPSPPPRTVAPRVVAPRGVDAGSDDDDVEYGEASMYADMLAGSLTASEEPYRVDKSTCAHRDYDFGTVLEIENAESGAKARCRVNDRGPNVDEHLIDVSKKVARALGMKGSTVVDVHVRVAADQSDPDRRRAK